MKEKFKTFIKKKGWYNHIRFSYPFSLYQRLFKASTVQEQQKEIQFYKSFLSSCNLIFDIGANDGHKTVAFLNFCRTVVCCEPDTTNYKLLQTRFRNKKKRVVIENRALSDSEGTAFLHLHHEGSAFNTLNKKWKQVLEKDRLQKWTELIRFNNTTLKVETTTLDLLIKKHGIPDFIKIDVEGYEQWVIKGLSQKVPCLTFESLLPDFKEELFNCVQRLEEIAGNNLYNIALSEQLLFEKFVNGKQLIEWINHATINHFEVVVKMND